MTKASEYLIFHPHTLTKQNNNHLTLTLFTLPELAVEQVYLRCEPDNEELLVPMKGKAFGELIKWQAKIPLSEHQNCTFYVFKLLFAGNQLWFTNEGISHWQPAQERHFRHNAYYRPAEWVKNQVFYQIFPDRFANGLPELSVTKEEYQYQNGLYPVVQKKWSQKVAASFSKKAAFEFYGGDLQGIINHLDYLENLGISALYLNPIFTSPSNHKYDSTDHLNVDPHFGGNEKLAELSQDLHKRGMYIMLDGVLNHTSAEHPWMDKYGVGDGSGAFANKDSNYRSYYNFDDFGNYWCWKGIDSLPKLDLGQPEVQNYLYKGEDSVIRHWLKAPYDIDGWRIDVAHMMGDGNSAKNNHQRFTEIKQAMQTEKSQAYLIGEHFHEATSWLQGEQEDGAMNYYGFTRPIRAFLAGSDIKGHPLNIDATQLNQWLSTSRGVIPFANQLAQFNLLNSHDTQRLITILRGDKRKLLLATVLLFTYVGVPSIYYGDEIGLPGGDDPDCRRSFPWQENQWDKNLLSHYRYLTQLRHQNACLKEGDCITLYAQNDCFVFARWLKNEHIIIAINRGEACSIELDISLLGERSEQYTNMFTQQLSSPVAQHLILDIAECDYLVLRAN